MEKITASIVVYKNDPKQVSRVIDSFLRSTVTGPLTIIDNSPSDQLRACCDRVGVAYIHSKKNLGYGKGHNLALREDINRSVYHLVLNPDVCFRSDILEKLFHFMEGNPQAGLVMPKVVDPDGDLQMLCKLLPSPIDLATRRFFPIDDWFRNRNEKYEMKASGYDRVMNVPFLSGCFMFFRSSALRHVGLFDERFFLYAEDTDLSRRMHLQYETLYFPHAQITHVHARGSYKDLRLTFHNTKSAFQYFNKWGWFFDKERKVINERATTLAQTQSAPNVSLREVKAA